VRLPIGTLTCSSPPDRQRRARALSRRQRGDPGGRTVRRWRPIPGGGPRAAAGIPAGPVCRLGARWPADPARPPRSSSTVQAKQVRVRIAQGGGVSAGPRTSTRGGRGRPRSGRLSAPLFLRTPGANLLKPGLFMAARPRNGTERSQGSHNKPTAPGHRSRGRRLRKRPAAMGLCGLAGAVYLARPVALLPGAERPRDAA